MNLFPNSVKCKKPKFSDHKGATWESCKVIAKDGTELEGFLDTSWGKYVYFNDGKIWRKINFYKGYMDDSSNLTNLMDFSKTISKPK